MNIHTIGIYADTRMELFYLDLDEAKEQFTSIMCMYISKKGEPTYCDVKTDDYWYAEFNDIVLCLF